MKLGKRLRAVALAWASTGFALLSCGGDGDRADTGGSAAPHSGSSGASAAASSSGGTQVRPSAGAEAGGSPSGGGAANGGGNSGGSVGVAGGEGGGEAGQGSGGAPDSSGKKCEPGVTYATPYGTVAGNCYSWGDAHEGIPNLRPTSLRYLKLPTPTTPGAPYALSLGMDYGSTQATIELWGSDDACGNARELLWWGPMRSGEICAEFEPTQAHSHVLMVWRPLWGGVGADHRTVTLCPAGSCGDARDGAGLGLDDPLEPPRGAIQVNAGMSAGPLHLSAKVGYGSLNVKGPTSIAVGGSALVSSGYFRMHESEDFDDAWYCPGPGSSVTWLEDKRAHIDFTGITRLADCAATGGGTGTATFTSAAVSNATTIVSNMPELADAGATITSKGCFKNAPKAPCTITYKYSDSRAPLRLHAFQALATRTEGSDLIQDFTDTALIVLPADYSPVKVACAAQGMVRFGADGSLTISLAGITPFGSCPGQAHADAAFSADLQF
jgi:hypothetical protein